MVDVICRLGALALTACVYAAFDLRGLLVMILVCLIFLPRVETQEEPD